jgi:NAD(P)H-dependent FMN reductase
MSVKLLALAASTRPESHNRRLLDIAMVEAVRAGASVTVLDYAECDAPMYQGDHTGPLPAGASVLSEALAAHDGPM